MQAVQRSVLCPAKCSRVSVVSVRAQVGPRHKGAKHHARSRPIKYCKSDRNHGPAVYAALPAPPPEFVVVSKKN